jgi:hypothetical protein
VESPMTPDVALASTHDMTAARGESPGGSVIADLGAHGGKGPPATHDGPAGMESALAAVQRGAEAAVKTAAGVTGQLRKARGAAASGQVRELRRALDAAAAQAASLAAAASDLRARYDFDEGAYLASGGYAKELLAAAAERGVAMFEEDERLLCYPSIVRLVPGDTAVEIDRHRERRLRPSVLVGLLAARQTKPPTFRPEPFLESLAEGYDLMVARSEKKPDAVVRLYDIWSVLTLLPGQGKEYPRPEFARDLYLLDQKQVRHTKDGRTLRWHASTGTRGAGVLTTVARTGQQQVYWGVSFTRQVP